MEFETKGGASWGRSLQIKKLIVIYYLYLVILSILKAPVIQKIHLPKIINEIIILLLQSIIKNNNIIDNDLLLLFIRTKE